MRGEQAIFNLEIKRKSGLSINPDIHHSKVFSLGLLEWIEITPTIHSTNFIHRKKKINRNMIYMW